MLKMIRLLAALAFFCHFSAFAVDCYQNAKGGATAMTATLPTFTIPANTPPGQKVWESPDINVTVYCDNASGWSQNNQTEDIFAWIKLAAFNSDDVLNNPYLTFGVTYNGVDHEINGEGIDTRACLDKYEPYYAGIWHDPVCNGSTLQKDITFNARFRLYVKLKAMPTTDITWDLGKVNVLQFDGEGGANLLSNAKNLRYYIDGLDHIDFLDCSVDIRIYPENQIVDFGQVFENSIPTRPSQAPFSVSTIRDASAGCTEQFDVSTSFYTDDTLYDSKHLDMNNGLLMRITDKTTGGDIDYNQYQTFATYIPGQAAATVTHDYIAELTRKPGSTLTMGPFSKDVIVKINYH
ncbi:pilus assembly protein [Pluralibacter sp.]|uniref:pilus assembly protein n=1 Tax=Pluralibacter sp. TaxID=1920032 RepID=UPI0025E1CEBA|nr:pilus assembly protein [Pluralibacter sp.]MBV8041065.1 pilus assembly protein [Pluralibacter sp.]